MKTLTLMIALKMRDDYELRSYARKQLATKFGEEAEKIIEKYVQFPAGNVECQMFSIELSNVDGISDIDRETLVELLPEASMERKIRVMPIESIMEMYHSGNEFLVRKSKEYIVKSYSLFVHDMIHKAYPSYSYKYEEELYQCGVEGILKAMKSYDVNLGAFTTFSKPFIMHELAKEINVNNNSTVHFNNLQKRISAAVDKLKEENLEITPTKIAILTDLKPEIVKRELDFIEYTRFQYLDAGECNEQACEFDMTPEAIAAKREKDKVLAEGLLNLPEDIRRIVCMRIQGHKNEEIAKITKSNIGKVKTKFQKGIMLMKKDPRIINAFPERYTTAEVEMLRYSVPVSTSDMKIAERIGETLSAMGILPETSDEDQTLLNIELSFKNL